MDLVWVSGRTNVARWRRGWDQGWDATSVTIGRLADGRWFAQRSGYYASMRDKREGACVYGPDGRGEHLARATARRWMRTLAGDWVEAG